MQTPESEGNPGSPLTEDLQGFQRLPFHLIYCYHRQLCDVVRAACMLAVSLML